MPIDCPTFPRGEAKKRHLEPDEPDDCCLVADAEALIDAEKEKLAALETENKNLREKIATRHDDVRNLRIAAEARIAEVVELRAALEEARSLIRCLGRHAEAEGVEDAQMKFVLKKIRLALGEKRTPKEQAR